jgi:hypothetical protein
MTQQGDRGGEEIWHGFHDLPVIPKSLFDRCFLDGQLSPDGFRILQPNLLADL